MSDVQEKGPPDNGGAYKDVREEPRVFERLLEPPDGLVSDDNGELLQGVHQSFGVQGVYRAGRRMAFFSYAAPPEYPKEAGCEFKVHRTGSLRWELYTFLALLQGASVSQLFGPEFALFGGTHSKPYEPLPEVSNAVLVEVRNHPEDMPAQQALAHARVQLTLQKSLSS